MTEDFEQQLRTALQRREAPEDFVDRVMARVPPARSRWRVVQLWAGSVAAVVVLGSALELRHVQETRMREAQDAQRQLFLAVSITNRTLDHVKHRLEQAATVVEIRKEAK